MLKEFRRLITPGIHALATREHFLLHMKHRNYAALDE